jgi:hypothetical protein
VSERGFLCERRELTPCEREGRFMIPEVRDIVKNFLKETIEATGVRIVSINKIEGGWVVEAEVAEMNQYLASINPEYRVFEKERYIIKLDAGNEVSSFKRARDGEEELEG